MLGVLDAREKRELFIKDFFKKNKGSLISIRANYPGSDKINPYTSYVSFVFLKLLKSEGWIEISKEFEAEGLIFMLHKNQISSEVKKRAVEIEEEHFLGRLSDIDVYGESRKEHRKDARKCFLCEKNAVFCVRSEAHSPKEVAGFFKKTVERYIFSKPYERIAEFSMISELTRSISFGTVNFRTDGCHRDMSCESFCNSVSLLSPMFDELSESLNYDEVKHLGLKMEAVMKKEIGVNTHQGLIFHLLLIFFALFRAKSKEQFRKNIILLGERAVEDFKKENADYFENKIFGARKSAKSGYAIVFEKTLPMFFDDLSVDKIFIALACETEDTNIFRRGGIEVLEKFRTLVSEIRDGGDLEKAEAFSVEKNISAGGSADLLAVTTACFLICKMKGWEV